MKGGAIQARTGGEKVEGKPYGLGAGSKEKMSRVVKEGLIVRATERPPGIDVARQSAAIKPAALKSFFKVDCEWKWFEEKKKTVAAREV